MSTKIPVCLDLSKSECPCSDGVTALTTVKESVVLVRVDPVLDKAESVNSDHCVDVIALSFNSPR